MRVILFGATGMVGQGVLRECLLDPGVERVLAVGRTATPQREEKLHDLVVANFLDFSAVERELSGYDACFFCLGIYVRGHDGGRLSPRHRTTIALAAAQTLVSINPEMTFVFVSGAGADSTGRGRVMWARVKGQTENALLALPFKGVYVFRPAAIQPLHGIRSKTCVDQRRVRGARSALPRLQASRARLRHHDRAGRARDARRRQTRGAEARARERRYQPAMMRDMLRAVIHGRARRRLRGLSLCTMLVALAPGSALAQVKGQVAPGITPVWDKGIQPIGRDNYWNAVECGKAGRGSARVRLLRHRLLPERRFRDRALHAVQARRL